MISIDLSKETVELPTPDEVDFIRKGSDNRIEFHMKFSYRNGVYCFYNFSESKYYLLKKYRIIGPLKEDLQTK